MTSRDDTLPFDLRSLEIFLAVAEQGAMAAAAKILRISQPAVSQAIADLEHRTGAKLLDRAVRPLALTPAGAILRQRASALMAEARQLTPLLREAEHRRLPALRVGLVDSLMTALAVPLARMLADVATEVSVLTGLTDAHAGALLTRRLDVFLGVDELADMAGLERWELVREPYILVLPIDERPPKTLSNFRDLAGRLPLVRFSARSKTGRDIDRHLARIKVDAGRCHEFDTPYGATAMVAAGGVMSITTPLCLASSGVNSRALSAAPLPGPAFVRSLTLVARHGELGHLPRDLALAARETLATEALPDLEQAMPWLAGSIVIPRRRTP